MMRFILGVLWLAFVGVGVADEPKAHKVVEAVVAKAMESFTGTWEIVAVTPDGATKDARRLVFKKDDTYAALDKDGTELWAGTFEIDPTRPRRCGTIGRTTRRRRAWTCSASTLLTATR
jgi:hypothetical protein